MLSLREKLAAFILSGEHTVLEWTSFQKQIPCLQLKTVSQGKVLISFNGEKFERPDVWLGNFQNRCIERFEAEKKKLLIVLPKERQEEILGSDMGKKDYSNVPGRATHYFRNIDWSQVHLSQGDFITKSLSDIFDIPSNYVKTTIKMASDLYNRNR
jgi:hypothetical protein